MSTRLVIVGSGIAGLYAALRASELPGLQVTLLSKTELRESNTTYAQGGIAAVLGPAEAAPGDSVEAHIADTLRAGAGRADPDAVRLLCTEAGADIDGLRRFGVRFDETHGLPALGLEAAHSAPRILHVGGDATGAGISSALVREVMSRAGEGRVSVLTDAFLTGVRTNQGRVEGVSFVHGGRTDFLAADAVLLATGGAGQLFEHTTNPAVATADGLAAAWRAGAVVRDLEFFQFHPTALAVPGNLLISEAVRGEGAVLRDAAGFRYMTGIHPDAELAPRDVVSRGAAQHLKSIGADPDAVVYLDATVIEEQRGTGFLARRFPTLDRLTRELGFDWTAQWLPVAPAAHYWMGGIATDRHGHTSVAGLYAAGEVAATGVHGANRLASNSLLEGLVFGRRAVEHVAAGSGAAPAFGSAPLELAQNGRTSFERNDLRRLMADSVSVLRDGDRLAVAAKQLGMWQAEASGPTAAENGNLLLAARLLVASARRREESVGAHFRSDFPHTHHLPTVAWHNPGATA